MSDKGQIRKLLYTRDRGSLQVKDARRELTSFKRSQPPPHPPCFVLLRRKEGADVSLQTFYHAWETHQATNCTRTSEKWTAATPSDCYNYTKDAVDALHRAHNGFCVDCCSRQRGVIRGGEAAGSPFSFSLLRPPGVRGRSGGESVEEPTAEVH
mmetsp:Transcript_11565/g.22256  ORF Transcript_11565/g.22256 Transcript_11565/m.22256 type:complete len:154 (-) Transcript_11565:456-917(-)